MAYALITGASKGIGKAIAHELASRGFDLLLVARTENLLQQVAQQLQQEFGVQVHVLSTDLTLPGAAETVFNWCRDNNYTVTALINNAGYGLSGRFDKYSLEENEAMLRINIFTLSQLTQLMLPQLQKQQQSYILNISSTSAYQAVPYLALYCASKAFVLQFSRAIRHELRKTSVSVTCISPGTTDTDFASRANVGPKALKAAEKFNMTPQAVARTAVKAMLQKKAEVIVGATNKIGGFFAWLLPKKLTESTVAKIYE